MQQPESSPGSHTATEDFDVTGFETVGSETALADVFGPARPISETTLFAGRKWSVVEQKFVQGHAEEHTSVFERHPGAVCVLAFNADNEVLLVRQYRHPVGSYCWEVPAGLLDVPGEQPVHAAMREFAEEALAQAQEWSLLADWVASPTIVGEPLRAFVAQGVEAAARPEGFVVQGEEREMVRAWVPFDTVLAGVLKGKVANPGLVIAVLSAARQMRKQWRNLREVDAAWPTHRNYRETSTLPEDQRPNAVDGCHSKATSFVSLQEQFREKPWGTVDVAKHLGSGHDSFDGEAFSDTKKPADVLGQERILSQPHFGVVRETFALAAAGQITREIVTAANRLVFFLYNATGDVFLQQRYVPATEHCMWQLPSCTEYPSGNSAPSRDLDQSDLPKIQEHLESKGFQVSQVSILGRWFETPGGFNQETHCVAAQVDTIPAQHKGTWKSYVDILAAIDDGNVHDFSLMVAALLAEYSPASPNE